MEFFRNNKKIIVGIIALTFILSTISMLVIPIILTSF